LLALFIGSYLGSKFECRRRF